MSVRRGDVVLLQAPFTNRAGAKTRPMLLVQNDANNARMANTILVFITTNLARSAEPPQVLVDVRTAEGHPSGLKQTSVVSCENILTAVQSDILRTIGHVPDSLMRRVDASTQGFPGSSVTRFYFEIRSSDLKSSTLSYRTQCPTPAAGGCKGVNRS